MNKIFIYGVAGTGKEAISHHLKARLNLPLIETDDIREQALALANLDSPDPFRYVNAQQAWRTYGQLSADSAIQGLQAVRQSNQAIIDNQLAMYEAAICEGVFLDPAYSRHGQMFLITTASPSRHRRQYYQHRPMTDENEEGFVAGRLLQEHLIQEAADYPVIIIENHGSPRQAETLILEHVRAT